MEPATAIHRRCPSPGCDYPLDDPQGLGGLTAQSATRGGTSVHEPSWHGFEAQIGASMADRRDEQVGG